MNYRSRGFTLTELLVALGVAGLLLGIVAPSMGDFMRNGRLTSAGNDFLGAAQLARTEAIKQQVPVAVCPSANPQAGAGARCAAGNFSGWIVFVDADSNCVRAAGELLLRGNGPLDATINARSNGDCISFAPTGFLQAAAAIPGHFQATRSLFCDARGKVAIAGQNQSAARGVFVTNTGRSRVSRDISSGTITDLSTWGACP